MEPITNEIKKWYKSKTMWLSIIAVALGLLQWIQGQLDSGLQLTIMGVVMALMRIVTSTKLE